MLTNLYIENLAVIEKASIDFDKGLNVFTGETGAGKSIVIDAINAIIGQRISKDIVRTGATKAVVVAVFDDLSSDVINMLLEFGFETDENELIIQREITVDGKSSARICSRPATAAILKELGTHLINIHGQHDNQILMSSDKHIRILDTYAELDEELAAFSSEYNEYKKMLHRLNSICNDETQKTQRIDLLSYQINEIESAELMDGEDDELAVKQKAIRNSSRIVGRLNKACESFYGTGEFDGAVELISSASSNISEAGEFYDQLSDLSQRLEGLSIEFSEAAGEVKDCLDEFDFDLSQLNQVESRLDEIYKLKRKYGQSVSEILIYLDKAKVELNEIVMSDEMREKLIKQTEQSKIQIINKAKNIRIKRVKAAKRFTSVVSDELNFLDMPNVVLSTEILEAELNVRGIDKVEFLISTNPGEPPKPVSKIASGGELSRIMLAIKTTLADKDVINTLIFDEIDSGVSGRAAQKIGLKLHEAGVDRQIFCVTHSAQIAALADTHLLISKHVSENRTFTKIQKLDFDGRKHELARIIGTDNITQLTLDNAEEMLKFAHKT